MLYMLSCSKSVAKYVNVGTARTEVEIRFLQKSYFIHLIMSDPGPLLIICTFRQAIA
jgi:hypothetical protein